MAKSTYSKSTLRAIEKYGKENCEKAFAKHQEGYGGAGVGFEMGITTRQADAAINAGREISKALAN